MAEFLVRIEDKDPTKTDASQRGDVITVQPDGWAWSQEERTNDYWRIIKAPILNTLAQALMSGPATPQDAKNKGYIRRVWKIDFSQFPDPTLFEGKRTQEIIVLSKNDVTKSAIQKF